MKKIIIKTQKEFDELPKEFSEYTKIEIRTDGSFWLNVNYAFKNVEVSANGSSTVSAYGSSKVSAYGSSTVSAYDSSTVSAYGSSTVSAYDSSTVSAYDSSTVSAYDSSTVSAYGSSKVSAYDSSTVSAYDSSKVSAYDSSTVSAYDSSTVSAYGSSTVSAYGSSTITAYLVCCIFIYSNLVKIKHLADQTTAKFFNNVDYKKVILKKDKTAQVIKKVIEPSFETWLERGIVKADGITRRLVSKKKIGAIESFEVQDDFGVKSFLVKKGSTFSHGNTLKEAKESLKYKISSRDTTPFKKWNLSTVVTQAKMIEAYRVITGACEYGVRGFMEGKKVPSKLSVKKAIELTSGAYGSNEFAGFFK